MSNLHSSSLLLTLSLREACNNPHFTDGDAEAWSSSVGHLRSPKEERLQPSTSSLQRCPIDQKNLHQMSQPLETNTSGLESQHSCFLNCVT